MPYPFSGNGWQRPLADIVTPATRSRMMAGIKGKDTGPELLIRKGLHALGLRFRLGDRYRIDGKKLPGRPDLVFPGRKAVVLVHGCFWHGHDCALFRWPATREQFWRDKITGNIARDARVRGQLASAGWRVLEVWECQLTGPERLDQSEALARCRQFLESGPGYASIGTAATVTTVV